MSRNNQFALGFRQVVPLELSDVPAMVTAVGGCADIDAVINEQQRQAQLKKKEDEQKAKP